MQNLMVSENTALSFIFSKKKKIAPKNIYFHDHKGLKFLFCDQILNFASCSCFRQKVENFHPHFFNFNSSYFQNTLLYNIPLGCGFLAYYQFINLFLIFKKVTAVRIR